MDREAWHAAVHRVTKSWTWLSGWTELNWMESWRAAVHGVAKSQTWLRDWTDWLPWESPLQHLRYMVVISHFFPQRILQLQSHFILWKREYSTLFFGYSIWTDTGTQDLKHYHDPQLKWIIQRSDQWSSGPRVHHIGSVDPSIYYVVIFLVPVGASSKWM